MRGRTESKEYWTEQMMKELKIEETLEHILRNCLDCGYCEGYNTVLAAAEAVLSANNYKKIVDYLNKKGM